VRSPGAAGKTPPAAAANGRASPRPRGLRRRRAAHLEGVPPWASRGSKGRSLPERSAGSWSPVRSLRLGRRRRGAHPHRTLRRPAPGQPRPDRADPPTTPRAGWPSRNRAPGDLRPQRRHRAVRRQQAQCAGTRRRVRRPHPLGLPHRRLPHLHHPVAVRQRHLLPGPARTPADGEVLICCAQPGTDIVMDM
jgi:hypothetical protein